MYKMCRRFSITFLSILVAMVLAGFLLLDNIGMNYTLSEARLTDLPEAVAARKEQYEETPRTCLLLKDSSMENHEVFSGHLEEVLQDMRVGYTVIDAAREEIPDFSSYKTVVLALQNLDMLGNNAIELCQWVQQGGGCMLFCTPEPTAVFRYLAPYMGVGEGGVSYSEVEGLNIKEGLMIGGTDFNFHWGEPMAIAINVRLNENAHVYMESDDDSKTPLLWSAKCGEGTFVVNNHGFAEKATSGLTCAAYSLLEETCIYPVINASAFFLDDFPSPVPMGDGTYIRRDYNRDISSFYSNVWWPDMLTLCEDYGIKYTGMLIEDYSDETDGVFPRQTDTERFEHFGFMLLDHGGEIGMHGYNHQPLCFNGFDFKDQVDYNTWPSEEAAERAMSEAFDYVDTLYPGNTAAVYVPPSNILSEEGRTFLKEHFPQIKVIASLYLEGEIEYSQEFEISEDGMIEFPRVISGAILDQYMRWDALNTLNLYYVNSHFMHPDDVLDEDRGAADGWEVLFGNLCDYVDWLYTSAPNIRNLTGSDAGRATARYDVLSIERTDTPDGINLRFDGFWDEACLMVRCNGRSVAGVTGGSLEHIDGDYYLLYATQDQVRIELEVE